MTQPQYYRDWTPGCNSDLLSKLISFTHFICQNVGSNREETKNKVKHSSEHMPSQRHVAPCLGTLHPLAGSAVKVVVAEVVPLIQ